MNLGHRRLARSWEGKTQAAKSDQPSADQCLRLITGWLATVGRSPFAGSSRRWRQAGHAEIATYCSTADNLPIPTRAARCAVAGASTGAGGRRLTGQVDELGAPAPE